MFKKLSHLVTFRSMLVVVSVLLIVFPNVYVVYNFSQLREGQNPSRETWLIFSVCIILLIVVGFLSTKSPIKPVHNSPRKTYILLACILLLALALRLYQLDVLPFGVWYDEAANAMNARYLWDDANAQVIFRDNMTYYHLWIHQIALALFGEASVIGLRLPSVLFGLGSVYLAFLVGRDLFDDAFGLGMAFFLAVPFWTINFSRIGMTGMDAVFVSLLTSYYLLRTLEYGSWRYVFCLGLSIGFGLWLYAAFRFVCLALFIAALTRIRFYQIYWLSRGLLIAMIVVLVTSPILAFVITQPDAYFHRTRQISIFEAEHRRDDSVTEILSRNLKTYALMFNVRGDGNARHNIPNEPMLDPIMGFLFIIGLVLGVFRRHSILFYLLLIFALLTGSLTIPSEAPNALRAIVAVIPAAYFCTFALRMLRFIPVEWLRVGSIVVICYLVGVLNSFKYFETFAHNPESFLAFSSLETVRGRAIAFYQTRGFDVLLPNRQSSSVISEFIAPDYRNKNDTYFDELHPFPLYTARPTALLLEANENDWIWRSAQDLYPNANFRSISPRDYGIPDDTVLLNIIEIMPEMKTEVPEGMAEIGLFASVYGDYQFDVSQGAIWLNEQVIETNESLIQLAIGYHKLQTDLPLDSLYWKAPNQTEWEAIPQENLLPNASLAGRGLAASIYKDERLILERIDLTPFAYFHIIPVARPYELVWSANLQVPESGEYEFRIEAVGLVDFSINDAILLSGQNIRVSETISLEEGTQTQLDIRFLDNTERSSIFLQWRPPNAAAFQPIPPWNLSPNAQAN
jgi:hypothetical protein